MFLCEIEGLLFSVKDARQLEIIKIKLDWLKNMVLLEDKVLEFKKIYGGYPQDLQDLIKANLIASIPEDSFGQGFYWDVAVNRIKSRFSSD